MQDPPASTIGILTNIRPSGDMALPRALLVLISIFLCVSFHSCSEDLPVYQEPSQIFHANVDAEYWLSDTEHSLRVYLRITNNFDETLEDQALLTGSIVVTSARDTTIHKTLLLTSKNLSTGSISSTGVLRINPKQTIVMKGVWDFAGDVVIDDNGRNLAGDEARAAFFKYISDPNCAYREFGRPEDLLLSGSVTLFAKTLPISADTVVFPFCFVTHFVDVRVCPRVVTVTPCSNLPAARQ